jgi:hypothetical protein
MIPAISNALLLEALNQTLPFQEGFMLSFVRNLCCQLMTLFVDAFQCSQLACRNLGPITVMVGYLLKVWKGLVRCVSFCFSLSLILDIVQSSGIRVEIRSNGSDPHTFTIGGPNVLPHPAGSGIPVMSE